MTLRMMIGTRLMTRPRTRQNVLPVRRRMHPDSRRSRHLPALVYLVMRHVRVRVRVRRRQKRRRDGRVRVQVRHPRRRQIAQIAQVAQVVRQRGHVLPELVMRRRRRVRHRGNTRLGRTLGRGPLTPIPGSGPGPIQAQQFLDREWRSLRHLRDFEKMLP